MGAGARLAEERDRWEDHWRMVDLERESEHLLDLLFPAEELRTAVPGLRTAADGESPVLVGITDRRVLVVGRWRVDASERQGPRAGVSVVDATPHVAGLARAASIEMGSGDTISFDLDDHTMDRMWAAMDGLAGVTGVG
jgi:hypothetical protein